MNRIAIIILSAAALTVAGVANANPELAKAKNCFACHLVDGKRVGPAYNDVAKKYAQDKDAEATLVKHIREGGVGQWGKMPMPPQAQVSEEEAKQLASWILSLGK